jgi:translation initiation factor 6 (eIF-6)
MSSIIDEIRNRQSQPPVEERADILVSTNVDSGSQPQASQLDVLKDLLAAYPTISNQQPIRLQAEIKAEIDTLCQREKITAETLFEALFIAARDRGSLPSVVAQAQERLRVRKEIGNLKSRITQLGNLLKNNGNH